MAATSISRFESYIEYRDFKTFRVEQAIAFKRHFANRETAGRKLSKATLHTTYGSLKRFFQWLSGQAGYRSKIAYSDAEYFSLSMKEARVATARRQRPVPTLEQVQHVIRTMPHSSELERRDRALLAFTLITGARDGAIASTRIKHVNIHEHSFFQDAREVKTKFSKSFTTFFFPVSDEATEIVVDWINYLRQDLKWGNEDPLFPSTKMSLSVGFKLEAHGLERKNWSNADSIRRIFRSAFVRAGLPYFNPHSFRNLLVRLGEERCRSPEEFKAWSQNLGHEQVLTTFTSYGVVATRRQAQLIQGMINGPSIESRAPSVEIANAVAQILKDSGLLGRRD